MHRKLQYVLSDLSYTWCLQPQGPSGVWCGAAAAGHTQSLLLRARTL